MSWRVYGQIKDIVIQLNGTDIEIAVLKPYGLGASWSNTFFNTYGATSGLVNASVSIRGESDPQYDTWAEYQAVLGLSPDSQCNDEYLFSKFTQIGDIISYTHKDINRNVCRLDIKWSRTLTEGGYTHNDIQWRMVYNGNTDGWSGNIIAHGKDSQGKTRHFQWGVCLDLENASAMVHYYWGAKDPNSYTNNRGSCTSYANSMSRNDFNARKYGLYTLFSGVYVPPEPTDDPYTSNNYGPGENQGGDGDGDDTSDTIAVPSNPTLEVTSSGMVTIFTPDITQIQALANALIDPNFFQALGNVFASLDEVILGLHIVPLVVPYSGPSTAISINLLGIAYRVSIGLYKATVQFVDVDCGTLDVNEYWGNCLDYNPYTKITIFLPFIGYVDIDADDVMNKTVGIKYRVDVATGACIAFITANGSVMYQYAGNCALPIPVSSTDQNSAIQNIVSIATAAVTGGAGIAAAGAAVADAESNFDKASGYKEIKAAISGLDKAKAHYESVTEKNKGKLTGVSANAVVNSKAQFHHGGSLGTSAGFMGIKKPYMIIRRPKQMIPDKYGAFNGYPTNTYVQLNDLIGYTRVSDIRLNIPDATVDEILECERLLKEGVVL